MEHICYKKWPDRGFEILVAFSFRSLCLLSTLSLFSFASVVVDGSKNQQIRLHQFQSPLPQQLPFHRRHHCHLRPFFFIISIKFLQIASRCHPNTWRNARIKPPYPQGPAPTTAAAEPANAATEAATAATSRPGPARAGFLGSSTTGPG